MAQYIDKTKVISEIERLQDTTIENGHFRSSYFEGVFDGLSSIERFMDTLEAKEVDLEEYGRITKILALSLMAFLDEHRPQGKMCLSNGECSDIEKAFDEMDWEKIVRYVKKYLPKQKGGES